DPPGEPEGVAPAAEPGEHHRRPYDHEAGDTEEAEPGQRRTEEPCAGESGEHVVDTPDQREDTEAHQQDEIGCRLDPAIRHGQAGEPESEESEDLEEAPEQQKECANHEMGDRHSVFFGATSEDGPDLTCGAGQTSVLTRDETAGAYTALFRVRIRVRGGPRGLAPARIVLQTPLRDS